MLFRNFAANFPKACKEYDNMDNKDNKKKKSGKHPATADGHKPNWREVYATVEEIEAFLSNHMYLRRNLVKGRVEYKLPTPCPSRTGGESYPVFDLPSRSGGDGGGWQPLTDHVVNTMWRRLKRTKEVMARDIQRLTESDFVPPFHPFRHYLEHLPPWDGLNHIMALSMTVSVRGGAEEQMRFYQYLRKWMVGMVAAWLEPEVVNHVILVLIGPQGAYKTTWFSNLLPPELRDYFRIKTNSSRLTKDDLLVLTQYGLVCCEELDTMRPSELNQLKSAVTMPSVDERKPYGHFTEHYDHVASFCGTGNNVQFLSDPTGNRRWLPFEVESIDSPRDHPPDYDAIYAEAYALYRQGFQYWFSQDEIQQLARHNEQFETPVDEEELVDYYFSIPSGTDRGEFMPTAVAQQIVSTPATRVTTVALGRAFRRLGFKPDFIGRSRGFYVVRRTEEERRQRARSMAFEASLSASQDNAQMHGCTDVF